MPEEDIDAGLEKAIAFFERAEEVASTDNFDYAIDMYLEGLRLAPDALEDGHAPLRKMALIRQGKGGKKPTVRDKMKRHGGKTPLDEMLNAEYLLAKDPDHVPYAETVLKAAVAGGYTRTAMWIAQLIYEANRASSRPSLSTYLLLKDSYTQLEQYDKAVAACQKALELKPHDGPLSNELRELSAQSTVKRGKYGEEGDFRNSIKDKEVQDKLHSQENLIKSVDFRQRAVEEAKRAVARADTPNNVLKLAEAYVELENDKGFQEAVKLLETAYKKYKDFSFKRREGELKLRKLKSNSRLLTNALKKRPDDERIREKLFLVNKNLESLGLEHYRLCVENYPTDLKMKYEYGNRLVQVKEYDMAIPMFQEAKKDPRYKISALSKTGLCFFFKGWYVDAIDIFQQALDMCEVQDSNVAKELRYNLARSYEEDGRTEEALEIYRKLAQLDFGYKDIRDRIDNLRSAGKE